MGSEATSIITAKLVRAVLSPRAVCYVLAFAGMCMMPVLYGQQDVHASLIPPAGRKSAPAFELVSQDGKKMHLSDYRGKVVLLNFWATDCGGCVLEIPSFIELERVYKDKDLQLLVSRWIFPMKA